MYTNPLIYEDTKLIVYKDINVKWKVVNDSFSGTFGGDLEYHQVYVNIHKFGLYQIACRYPMLPCMDMIHWVASHTDLLTITLSSVSGTDMATFREDDYDDTYQVLKPTIIMETPFNIPISNSNSIEIFKNWVNEPTKVRMTPNQVHKMKILWKVYQYLFIFLC